MKRRTIEGATCAACRQPTGLVTINGRTLQTEPTACVADGVILLEMHRCPEPPPASTPGSSRSSSTRSSASSSSGGRKNRPTTTGR